MIYEIKRLDLLSVFKVSFLVYLVIGFLLGVMYGMFLMKIMTAFSPVLDEYMMQDFGSVGVVGAFFMAFFMAVFMSIIWSVLTVIAAGIYNLLCGWVGGVKIELAAPAVPHIPPAPSPPSQPSP